MSVTKQVDYVSLARGTDLDLVIAAEGDPGENSFTLDHGDDALKRALDELLNTPFGEWIWAPFYGHRLDELVQMPDGPGVLVELNAEWRRLMERFPRGRVRPESASVIPNVGINEDTREREIGYIFSVKSAITGRLISVERR